jgi:hypothetical protein
LTGHSVSAREVHGPDEERVPVKVVKSIKVLHNQRLSDGFQNMGGAACSPLLHRFMRS